MGELALDPQTLQLGNQTGLREQRFGLGHLGDEVDTNNLELLALDQRRELRRGVTVVFRAGVALRGVGLLGRVRQGDTSPAVEPFDLTARDQPDLAAGDVCDRSLHDTGGGLARQEPPLDQSVRLAPAASSSALEVAPRAVGDCRSNGLMSSLNGS